MTRKQRHRDYVDCPIEAALDLIGGKWKGSLLYRLAERTQRFNELRRLFPKISQRMLTNQLRELEADGLVHREVFAEIPPRVEYSLTERGRTLLPALEALEAWGTAHVLGPDPAVPAAAPFTSE
ncbi:MAG: winged helix-turn-helix transcriptional regulator [Paracoccaceae bacterium]